MTKDTNATGGAAIKRYKIGYHTDEWGVRSSTPGGITDPSGQWVLYKDHLAALASHGKAPAQAAAPAHAGEYPALVCDYCGALTPDPWHSSGMLHGKMSKHIHSCDACWRGAAQPAPVRGTPADLPPLPDPDLRDVGTNPEDIKNFLRGYATEYAKVALAARAPADSVLEDAARLEIDLFNDLNRIYGNTLTAYAKEMCRLGYRKTNAARKQGETNEH